MEFHKSFRLTLTFLFYGGIYLPTMRKFVKSKFLIVASKFFGKVLPMSTVVYVTSVMIPVFDSEVSVLDKILNSLASMVCFSIVVKSLLLKRDTLKMENLIKTWDEMNNEMDELCPNLGKKMLLKRKKITDIWSIVFGSIITGVLASTSVVPFFSRKLEHPTAMPTTAASPQFEILCLYELVMGSSLCFLTNAYNCFLMQMVAFEHVICIYLTEALEIITRSASISEEGKMTYDSSYYHSGNVMSYDEICADVEKKFRKWINLHQKLIRYNGLMQDIYRLPLFLDYVGLILIVAVVTFLVVSGSLNAPLIFDTAAYTVTVYTLFYVTCYYRDLVESTSENLFRGAFDQCWYAYPEKIRSAYLFIVMRCGKPLALKALNVYPLDSRNFGLAIGCCGCAEERGSREYPGPQSGYRRLSSENSMGIGDMTQIDVQGGGPSRRGPDPSDGAIPMNQQKSPMKKMCHRRLPQSDFRPFIFVSHVSPPSVKQTKIKVSTLLEEE